MNKFTLADLQAAFRLALATGNTRAVHMNNAVPRHLRSKYQPHQSGRECERRLKKLKVPST